MSCAADERNVQRGNIGIAMRSGVTLAELDNLVVSDVSGCGVLAGCATVSLLGTLTLPSLRLHMCTPHHTRSPGVTATMRRVRVSHTASSSIWLNASGACTLVDCAVDTSLFYGICCDAAAACVLDGCSAKRCASACFISDFPETELNARGGAAAAIAALLATPHSAKARRRCCTSPAPQ